MFNLHVVSRGSITRDNVGVAVLNPADKSAQLGAGVDLGSVNPGLTAVVQSVVYYHQVDVVGSS